MCTLFISYGIKQLIEMAFYYKYSRLSDDWLL